MTKPRLAKVRALFYVLQQVTKEAAPILTQPLGVACGISVIFNFYRLYPVGI